MGFFKKAENWFRSKNLWLQLLIMFALGYFANDIIGFIFMVLSKFG